MFVYWMKWFALFMLTLFSASFISKRIVKIKVHLNNSSSFYEIYISISKLHWKSSVLFLKIVRFSIVKISMILILKRHSVCDENSGKWWIPMVYEAPCWLFLISHSRYRILDWGSLSGYSNVNVGVLIFGRELFCDFGDNFVVNDVDGEEPISNMVASITKVRQTQTD